MNFKSSADFLRVSEAIHCALCKAETKLKRQWKVILSIKTLLEMFHFFACLRVRVTSKVFTTKFVPIATLSVAIFLVIAIIACTAAKAFEEQTWTAFAILLVVSVQVLVISCKCIFLVLRYAVEIDK